MHATSCSSFHHNIIVTKTVNLSPCLFFSDMLILYAVIQLQYLSAFSRALYKLACHALALHPHGALGKGRQSKMFIDL